MPSRGARQLRPTVNLFTGCPGFNRSASQEDESFRARGLVRDVQSARSTMRSLFLCVLLTTGCSPSPTLQPDGGSDGDLAKPVPCSGQPGDFHSVGFESGGETRYYFLRVPESYQCDTAWSL